MAFEEFGTVGIPTLFTKVFQHKDLIVKEIERFAQESTMFVKSREGSVNNIDVDMSSEDLEDWFGDEDIEDVYEFPLEQFNV